MPATPQMSDKVFKNVQVLKGIPVDEFMGTMGVFTTSLSLCCGNCHTGAGTSNPKWEDDPPRKRTARAMIAMVQNINKTRFGGRQVVTCWTCHRGQTSPSVTPPLDFAYGDAVVNPPDLLARDQNATKTVDQIFDEVHRRLKAARRRSTRSRATSGKGKSLLFGEVGEGNPAEIFAKADGHVATFVHQQEGDVVRALDGTNGLVAAAADRHAAVSADCHAARRREVRRDDGVSVEDPDILHQLARQLRPDDRRLRRRRHSGQHAVRA